LILWQFAVKAKERPFQFHSLRGARESTLKIYKRFRSFLLLRPVRERQRALVRHHLRDGD